MIHCQLPANYQPAVTAGLCSYYHGSATPYKGWQPGSGESRRGNGILSWLKVGAFEVLLCDVFDAGLLDDHGREDEF